MMSINLALVIVLSVMVAVLWCYKCDEHNKVETFVSGNFNNRNINSDAIRGLGMGKYESRYFSPSGWSVYKPTHKEGFVIQEEPFTGGCGCGF